MATQNKFRILLSPPHMGTSEKKHLMTAFDSNWIVPLGPYVDQFEETFSKYIGEGMHCAALSSGTAALHLALKLAGIQEGDEVLCSDLTFIASASPICFEKAKPVFIDATRSNWNLDLNLLEDVLKKKSASGKVPKAIVAVHLYGVPIDMPALMQLCDKYGVAVIEDAAESLGSKLRGRSTGTFGKFGVFSFNGNKIITTSGGGLLCSSDKNLIEKAKYLATQARQPVPHYEHTDVGYNYRLSNLLAAVGVGQLEVLEERVRQRRANYAFYREHLGTVPGIDFIPEPVDTRVNNWLTCIVIDPKLFGVNREAVRLKLAENHIEARPVWKPMHLQPVFKDAEFIGGTVGKDLFENGLCLPSGSALSNEEKEDVVSVILSFKG